MGKRSQRALIGAGLVMTAALSAPALAQQSQGTGPNSGIADIVVTATKMGSTNLQSTPIAVTALSADLLDKGGVRDVQDLKSYVPSLQVSDLSGYTQLYIRGVGSNIVYIGSDPSTTIHLDGVYLARPLSYLNSFLDVDRVEVLRGPQGTLYGRNSVGGTINVISRRPSDTLDGEVEAEYGTYNLYAVKGYITGPIANGISASLAFDISGHDAFLKNVSTGNDLEDLSSRGVRGQVRIPIAGSGDLTLRADYSRQAGAFGGYPKLLEPDGVALDDSTLGNTGKVSMDGYNHTVFENYGVSADLNLDVAKDIKLHSLTAWRGFSGSIQTDADSSSISELRDLISPIRQQQVSEELSLLGKTRLLDWVLGGYFFNEVDREPQTLAIMPYGISYAQRPRLVADSYAVFGQGELHITPQLSVIAGLRFTTESKHFSVDDRYTASLSSNPDTVEAAPEVIGAPGIPDPFFVDATRHDHALTPKFGLNYKPAADMLLYASATRGFKSGGFDYGAATPATVAAGYGPEKLWSYEAGIKSDWFEHRLRVDLTGFFYDYTDLQVEHYVQVGASFGAVTQNAATAHVKGLEAEIVARPVRPLRLYANLAWLDAHYVDYADAYVNVFGNFDASGKKLNDAPNFSGTFGWAYTLGLAAKGSIEVGTDVHVQSTVYFTPANDGVEGVTGYAEQQRGYGLLNAHLGWASADKLWTVSVVGNNLTNRYYILGTANYTAAIAGRPGRPREVFGQIARKF